MAYPVSFYQSHIRQLYPEVAEPEQLKELMRLRDASIHFYYSPTNSIYSASLIDGYTSKADDNTRSTQQIRAFNGLPAASNK
jgi:hypothetical protein